jgi:hypothetical protein
VTDAERCRKNGWKPGTLLAGDEGYGVTVIRITAVGEDRLLARAIEHAGKPVNWGEQNWTLICRKWRKVALLARRAQRKRHE